MPSSVNGKEGVDKKLSVKNIIPTPTIKTLEVS